MAIVNQNITTGATVDVLTVPAGKSYAITSVLITNTHVQKMPQVQKIADFICMQSQAHTVQHHQ